jgi:probable rRNA maturation factor
MKLPSGGQAKTAPLVDIVLESTRWKAQPRAKAVIRKAVAAAAKATSTSGSELAIVLTNDSAIRALNRDWRSLDAPTNVLSFPAIPPRKPKSQAKNSRAKNPQAKPTRDAAPSLLGDIVIAYQYTAREAKAEGKPFSDHLAHLTVHGFLHLLGYDHETDAEAETMERLERKILAQLGLPDPYAPRVGE